MCVYTTGFSGADLANLLNESAILTGRKNLTAITNKVRSPHT
jgi:ATP-dependent Zn protease